MTTKDEFAQMFKICLDHRSLGSQPDRTRGTVQSAAAVAAARKAASEEAAPAGQLLGAEEAGEPRAVAEQGGPG